MKVEGQISKTKVFDPMRYFTRCPFKEETGVTWQVLIKKNVKVEKRPGSTLHKSKSEK